MKWVKLTTDRKYPGGLVYICAKGHDWFVSFETLREIDSVDNVCPTCWEEEHDSTQTDTAADPTE